MDIYDAFIEYLQALESSLQGYYENHRVTPGHESGEYTEGNVVKCSFHDHKLAHYYRWLAKGTEKDRYAWRKMCGWRDEDARREMAVYAGKLGGRKTAEAHKERGTNFYDPEFGRKASLMRPAEEKRAWMLELNTMLTTEQRSKAGHLGGVSCTNMQKDNQTGLFDPEAKVQRRGNLKRWGIKIDGVRIPYSSLSSDFIDYQVNLGTTREYYNPCNQQPSRPSEDGRFRD
jgi:hypothetical protein